MSDQDNQTGCTDAEIEAYLRRALDWGDVVEAGLAAKALGFDTTTLPLLEREQAVLSAHSEASARAEIEHKLGEIAAGRMEPPQR